MFFPAKIFKCEVSLIDTVFTYITRFHSCTVSPIVNGLCDHSAQYLILKDVFNLDKTKGFQCTTRLICQGSISYFRDLLSSETWVNICQCDDVNDTFNLFLSTFLVIFEHCFFNLKSK